MYTSHADSAVPAWILTYKARGDFNEPGIETVALKHLRLYTLCTIVHEVYSLKCFINNHASTATLYIPHC